MSQIGRFCPTIDMESAEILCNAWATIEATPKMCETFVREWIGGRCEKIEAQKNSPEYSDQSEKILDKAIDYFVDLAYQLDMAENPISETRSYEKAPEFPTGFFGTVDEPQNPELRDRITANIVPRSIDDLYDPSAMTDYQAWTERNTWANDSIPGDQELRIEDRVYPDDDLFRYVVINNDLGEDRWIKTQPRWFENMLKSIKAEESYAALKKRSGDIRAKQESSRLTSAQARVLWSAYKHRKIDLRDQMSAKHKALPAMIDRVLNVPDQKVAYTGFWLYDQSVNHGQQLGVYQRTKDFTKDCWNLLRDAYWHRKQRLAEKNAGLLDGI